MKKRIESLFWFVVENGPTVITIAFAVYVIALAQTATLPTDTLLQWVLAILGLLATSELVERLRKIRRIEQMGEKTLEAIQHKFGEKPSADDFFMRRLPRLEPYFEQAINIHLSGMTLQRTIRENLDVLARRLREGASIRVIVMTPNGMAAQQHTPTLSLEYLQANSKVTQENIKWLSEHPESKGTIELRYMDEYPHYNVIAIDSDKDYGITFIEFYAQRWTSQGRPRMELAAKRDREWFTYFNDQFDKLWKECTPVSLDESPDRQAGFRKAKPSTNQT